MKVNPFMLIILIGTNRNIEYLLINLNGVSVPHANVSKYLGMNLDAKLRWKEHIEKKCEELNIKFRKMY